MVSKKQKEKKKRIRERQTAQKTGSLERNQVSSLQMRLSKLLAELSESRSEVGRLRRQVSDLEKESKDQDRKLRARERLMEEMQGNHRDMRYSLTRIREIHMPNDAHRRLAVDRVTGQVIESEFSLCKGCGHFWPCDTYRKIKTPDHLVVTSLMDIERELSKEDPT